MLVLISGKEKIHEIEAACWYLISGKEKIHEISRQ
jgi:hypothetical protein